MRKALAGAWSAWVDADTLLVAGWALAIPIYGYLETGWVSTRYTTPSWYPPTAPPRVPTSHHALLYTADATAPSAY